MKELNTCDIKGKILFKDPSFTAQTCVHEGSDWRASSVSREGNPEILWSFRLPLLILLRFVHQSCSLFSFYSVFI